MRQQRYIWVLIQADESCLRIQVPPNVYLPSVVLSFFHQDEDLTLKSSRIIVNNELFEVVLLRSSLKLDRKLIFGIFSWLEDLQTTSIYPLLYTQFCKKNFKYISHINLGFIISFHRHPETLYNICICLLVLYYLVCSKQVVVLLSQ